MMSMRFYCHTDPEGHIHVQNAVMGMLGQHHVHTFADFKAWKRRAGVAAEDVVILKSEGPCCDLQPGQTRDHTGVVHDSGR